MPIDNWVAEDIDELVAFRRDLHRHPELLYDLPRTSGRVRDELEAAGVDETETAHAVAAATALAGPERVDANTTTSLGGEDFSFLLERCPGAMIYTGNGDSAGLHHPAYDFDDKVIPWGCSYWMELVRQRLGSGRACA